MGIEQTLEGFDLRYVMTVVAMIGFFLAVYVNQLTHYEGEDIPDPWVVRNGRRVLYLLLSWSFLWVLSYGDSHGWRPWPPVILMIFSIDGIFILRAVAIKARIKRTGVKTTSLHAEAIELAKQ
jgi:hypothetical protein